MKPFWKIWRTPDKPKHKRGLELAEVPAVKTWLAAGDTLLIDIREAEEHFREAIPGAVSMPLSTFPSQLQTNSSVRRVVFHCQSGTRTHLAANRLAASTSLAAYGLTGGLNAWKRV